MRQNWRDRIFEFWIDLTRLLACGGILCIFVFLGKEALVFLKAPEASQSLFQLAWFPSENRFGIMAMVVGSVLVVGLSLLQAWPIARASAIYLGFFSSPRTSVWLLGSLQLMAAIPSVVVGLFGLSFLLPILAVYFPPAFGLLVASFVLSFVLLPSLIINVHAMLVIDTDPLLEVGKSLGISTPSLIRKVILPQRRRFLRRALILGAGRAFGETLAVLLVAGNNIQLPKGLFEPFRTLNATIALEMSYAQGLHRSALFFLGLCLLLLVCVLRFLAGRENA